MRSDLESGSSHSENKFLDLIEYTDTKGISISHITI